MKDDNTKNFNTFKPVKFMMKMAWIKRKSVLFIALSISIITVLLNLAEIVIVPLILAKLEAGSSIENLLYTIAFFTFILMFLNVLKAYFDQLKTPTRIEIRLSISNLINQKYTTMSYPYVEDIDVVEKHKKCNAATMSNDSPCEAIWNSLTDLLVALLSFIIYIVMLTNVNIILIMVSAITCIISFFISKKINEWGYRHRKEKEEYTNKLLYASNNSEDLSFAKDVRIFGMKQWIDDMYYVALNMLNNFAKRREKNYFNADFIDIIFAFARNGLAYFYLIHLVLSESIAVSEFLLYFTTVSAFTSMLTQFLNKLGEIQKQSIEISALTEFLEMKELFKFEDGKSISPKNNTKYELKLNNLSFKYPKANEFTLKNINLTLKPGEKIAVVGLNGAGKTTLVKLLCGFYDPTEGEVLLNGENIKDFNRRDYYTFFTAVFQDFSVLDVPITENVAQSKTDIDFEKVNDCIQKAGLTNKVNSLENGVYTYVGRNVYEDGVELSGGEIQRLMLARALYKNAPIIILDEPTAALDPLAESDIYNKYNEMTQNNSSIFISHRLASTRFCDRIILIDEGVIIEEGTHEELLNLGKKYAELFEVQSKYYREGENF